jgi:hypothetical protein
MLCDYGCGQEAKFEFKNGKWCCSKSQNSCLEIRKKISESNKEKEPINKGKTYEELYGKRKAKELKLKKRKHY